VIVPERNGLKWQVCSTNCAICGPASKSLKANTIGECANNDAECMQFGGKVGVQFDGGRLDGGYTVL
jgi:hypothetical protein